MKIYKSVLIIVFFALSPFTQSLLGQNEASKWYFGNQAGLNFMTNPPSIVQGSMNANDGCASIADAAGNLLFYTNGATIWNQNHQVMQTGLQGNVNAGQNSIIIKQPGNSNIYFVFTTGWNQGMAYSTVDMNLAAGMGSVAALNTTLLAANNGNNNNWSYIDRISATKHCNGTDIWVVAKDFWWNNLNVNNNNTQNFYSFLVTAAGVSLTPVITAAQTFSNNGGYTYGTMKISPNGTKIGLSSSNNWWNNGQNQNGYMFELWDFNSGTGVISNSLALGSNNWNNNNWAWGYGVEFSPDGTKFYGSNPYWNNLNNNTAPGISQWDLCAGSPTAIAASEYTVTFNNFNQNNNYYSMQVAPNGKIYVARYNQTSLDVISTPNNSGAACGFAALAQSTGTRVCYSGLPNFMTTYLSSVPPLPPFTYTVNNTTSCLTVSFTAPSNPTFACSAMGYNVNNIGWNFGDPGSGAANTSTLQFPNHLYPQPGTYTTVLTYYNSCGSNTVALPVVINGASLTVVTASITCANLGSATVSAQGGVGPFSYTWQPTAQTSSVANGLQPGNYSITVVDNGGNCAYTSTVNFASLIPLTGIVDNSPNIPCNGVPTGTASVVLAGGSGNYYYSWYNGASTITVPSPTNLTAGVQTLTVIDAITSCSMAQNYFINQPPPVVVNIIASSPTTCAGTSITFTAGALGGTPGPLPGYTFTWTGGPGTNTRTVTQALPGNYTYSVTSRDGNNCAVTESITVTFVVNPTITVSNFSICPTQVGTLTPAGATSYTWIPSGLTTATYTDNPLTSTRYTVSGSALGCTATAVTASIVLKPVPSPTITSNSPVCNGKALTISSNNGSFYQWSGPLGFNMAINSPTINPAAPGNSGVYSLTLTAANSCTASTTATLTVHPTPTIVLSSNTVCVTQTLNLNANSFAGATFTWTGPGSYSSTVQNSTRNNAATGMTGTYSLMVTSIEGCTNSAQTSGSVVAMPIPLITANAGSMCLGSNLNFSGSGGILYNWSGPNGFASPAQNPGINNVSMAANGIYTLLVTTGPCTITTTKNITVWALPAPTASSPAVCDGKNLIFSTTPGGGTLFFWTGPGSFTSAAQNPIISPSNQSQTGLYTLLVTDPNGCQASTSTQANVMPNPDVRATGATVCYGHPAVLTASGAVSYVWTSAGYTSYQQTAVIGSAMNLQLQAYQVMGMASNGCTTIATVVLKTIPLPIPTASITQKACINSTINLTASGGDFYEWVGPYNYYTKTKDGSFVANNLAYGGIYTLTAFSNAGCNAKTTTSLQLDPAPEGDLVNTTKNYCVPFCSEFSLQSRNNVPVSNTIWQINGHTYDAPTFTYCITYPGEYVVAGSFTNALGCMNTSTFVISGYALPTANFEYYPENPIENFDQVNFVSTSSGQNLNNWSWYFIDNSVPKATGETTSFMFEKAGIYPVAMIVKNNRGCADTIIKVITVDNDFNIYVPTAFTPNADELNDFFFAKGTGIVKFDIVVFDRWGEKVFTSTDITKGWDGTFKGQECKSDVYVWKLKVSDAKGKVRDLNGYVTLYR